MTRFIAYLFVVFSVFSFSNTSAQRKQTREQYIERYQKLAINKMREYGIPASITMAQGCLESANGNSELAVRANNHFGIKCKRTWKGKTIRYDDDRKNECFRKYRSSEDSYADHSKFLTNNPRYASLFDLDITDYKGWAHGLKRAGYATDPRYAHRLIKIIEDNKLYLLDQPDILADMGKRSAAIKEGKKDTTTLSSKPPKRKVKVINGLKTVSVKVGDSFESICREMGLKYWEIYHYNDYKKGVRPRVNEILYIEGKYTKARKPNSVYTAKQGDTMHFIAQRFGMKLKSLLRKNRMQPGDKPQVGQKIYLRKKAPRS
ncbi:LysM peptidoglycan-binding domain-containing protein [Prolixibacteraceae bacterium JC049]|nr:LysM peptidoglycan-binding domain-containing protein [Prolixibacteraceae bacterium JC049]